MADGHGQVGGQDAEQEGVVEHITRLPENECGGDPGDLPQQVADDDALTPALEGLIGHVMGAAALGNRVESDIGADDDHSPDNGGKDAAPERQDGRDTGDHGRDHEGGGGHVLDEIVQLRPFGLEAV